METKAMSKNKTQEERLDYLVEEFKADSAEYKELQTPNSTEDKRRILRSLMNIRMSYGKGSKEEQINRLKKEISEVDAIVIGAGAGLSTSAGLTYSGELGEK